MPACGPGAGGKSPIIVTADADIDLAVQCIAGGIFYNAGQMCSSTSRLIVERRIEPRLIEALEHHAKGCVVGSPLDADTQMGPITHLALFGRVSTFLDMPGRTDCPASRAARLIATGRAISFRRPFVAMFHSTMRTGRMKSSDLS